MENILNIHNNNEQNNQNNKTMDSQSLLTKNALE